MMLSVIRNSPDELDELYFFATRRIESDYIQRDLGIGKETVVKAGASSINKGLKEFREAKKKIQDAGALVEKYKAGQKSIMSSLFGGAKKSSKAGYTPRLTVRNCISNGFSSSM